MLLKERISLEPAAGLAAFLRTEEAIVSRLSLDAAFNIGSSLLVYLPGGTG